MCKLWVCAVPAAGLRCFRASTSGVVVCITFCICCGLCRFCTSHVHGIVSSDADMLVLATALVYGTWLLYVFAEPVVLPYTQSSSCLTGQRCCRRQSIRRRRRRPPC